MEGEGCRYGEVEKDNSWGGAAVHELASPPMKGATRLHYNRVLSSICSASRIVSHKRTNCLSRTVYGNQNISLPTVTLQTLHA